LRRRLDAWSDSLQFGAGSSRSALALPARLTACLPFSELVEPVARGDPESFLRWTAKSTRKLAGELKRYRLEFEACLTGQYPFNHLPIFAPRRFTRSLTATFC